MDPHTYHEFTRQLIENLEARPDVLGLVAVGSMAATDTQPDAWSDHDFYVVVESGGQVAYRQAFEWLPDHPEIAWAFQDTEHGVKVIYRSGHLVEFAVFDQQEIYLAKTNRFRVLLDRNGLAAQMAEISANTAAWADYTPDLIHAGQFLTSLLVGLGRYQRGELLSAQQLIKNSALSHLLVLLQRHAVGENHLQMDNIDPTRRFELTLPALGDELNAIISQALPQAAAGLFAVFQREAASALPGLPGEVVAIVQQQIAALNQ